MLKLFLGHNIKCIYESGSQSNSLRATAGDQTVPEVNEREGLPVLRNKDKGREFQHGGFVISPLFSIFVFFLSPIAFLYLPNSHWVLHLFILRPANVVGPLLGLSTSQGTAHKATAFPFPLAT